MTAPCRSCGQPLERSGRRGRPPRFCSDTCRYLRKFALQRRARAGRAVGQTGSVRLIPYRPLTDDIRAAYGEAEPDWRAVARLVPVEWGCE